MKYSGMGVVFWLDPSFMLINDLGNLSIELLVPIFIYNSTSIQYWARFLPFVNPEVGLLPD